jgi:hypothetical protein
VLTKTFFFQESCCCIKRGEETTDYMNPRPITDSLRPRHDGCYIPINSNHATGFALHKRAAKDQMFSTTRIAESVTWLWNLALRCNQMHQDTRKTSESKVLHRAFVTCFLTVSHQSTICTCELGTRCCQPQRLRTLNQTS